MDPHTKKAVITALFNRNKPTDEVGECKILEGYDYYLFTYEGQEVHAPPVWKIVRLPHVYNTDVKMAKYVKWMTHKLLPDYDIVIWLDAFLSVNTDEPSLSHAIKFIENDKSNFPFAIQVHPSSRDCYEETVHAYNCKKIDDIMRDSVLDYLTENSHIRQSGGYWSCMIIKQNKHRTVQALSEKLFHLIDTVCYRDQVWITYLFDVFKVRPAHILQSSMFLKTGKILNHRYC